MNELSEIILGAIERGYTIEFRPEGYDRNTFLVECRSRNHRVIRLVSLLVLRDCRKGDLLVEELKIVMAKVEKYELEKINRGDKE